jgi:hypothetical protein
MGIAAAAISGLSLVVVIVVSVVLFINAEYQRQKTDNSVKSIVTQLNDTQFYAYKYDKNQQTQLQKQAAQVAAMEAKVNDANNNIKKSVAQLNTTITGLRNDSVLKEEIQKGIPLADIGKVIVGGDYALQSDKGFLGIKNKDGTLYKPINTGGINSTGTANFTGPMNITGNTNIMGDVSISGGASDVNPNNNKTIFNAKEDRRNYIRGDTIISGNTHNEGNLNVAKNFNVQGRIHFKDASLDTNPNWNTNSSDSYFLEKHVVGPNESSLRLTLTDDADESLQIWGGPANNSSMRHRFGADGSYRNTGTTETGSIVSKDAIKTDNAFMSKDGQIFAGKKISIGTNPAQNTQHRLMVEGGEPGQWSTVVRNGPTTIAMGHSDGHGVSIKSDKSSTESALDIYSATGELLKITNNGNVSLGRADGNGTTEIRSRDILLGRNGGDKAASIYLGGTNGDADWNHTVIESRNWGGPDKSELLIFKGNDPKDGCSGTCGPDRVRIRAAEIDFDVYKDYTVDRNAENIVARVTTDRVTVPKVQLGNKFLLSGVGDIQNDDEWLRLMNKDDTGYYGGFAAGKLWSSQGSLAGSDARMKTDIQPISKEDMTSLKDLKPKKYVLKESNKPDYGFIAQEVEKVYPDLVQTGPNDMKSLNYNGIIPLVVENINDIRKNLPDSQNLCIGKTCLTEADITNLKKIAATTSS